jgi:hypothetical protein
MWWTRKRCFMGRNHPRERQPRKGMANECQHYYPNTPSSLTVGNSIHLTVYHPSFPMIPLTQLYPLVPCDTKQFVKKNKKKDKVQQ